MRSRRCVAFVALALASCFTILAAAQPRKPAGKPAAVAPAKRPAAKPADDPDAGSIPLAGKEGTDMPSLKDAGTGKGGGVLDQRTLDGGGKVFRFGEVEVEGRLKSPQIVYFLRRVRAEFNAGDLGHRSFIRELGETKNEPAF